MRASFGYRSEQCRHHDGEKLLSHIHPPASAMGKNDNGRV
jgi:hypothetical protein